MGKKRNVGIILCLLGIIGFTYAAVFMSTIENGQSSWFHNASYDYSEPCGGWCLITFTICLPISTVLFLVGLALTIDAIATIKERNKASHTINSTGAPGKKGSRIIPIKTKIAALWIIIASVVGIIVSWEVIETVFQGCDEWCIVGGLAGMIIFFAGVLSAISAVLLTLKPRGPWIAAVVLLIIVMGCWTFAYTMIFSIVLPGDSSHLFLTCATCGIFFLLYLIPFVLIILDKNKYWAMVEHRTAKKKTKPPADEMTSHPSGGL